MYMNYAIFKTIYLWDFFKSRKEFSRMTDSNVLFEKILQILMSTEAMQKASKFFDAE